jgi:hypothetical protein
MQVMALHAPDLSERRLQPKGVHGRVFGRELERRRASRGAAVDPETRAIDAEARRHGVDRVLNVVPLEKSERDEAAPRASVPAQVGAEDVEPRLERALRVGEPLRGVAALAMQEEDRGARRRVPRRGESRHEGRRIAVIPRMLERLDDSGREPELLEEPSAVVDAGHESLGRDQRVGEGDGRGIGTREVSASGRRRGPRDSAKRFPRFRHARILAVRRRSSKDRVVASPVRREGQKKPRRSPGSSTDPRSAH